MELYKFVFDLDATITQLELLPELSRTIGRYEEIKKLTKETMIGQMPFADSFLTRVDMLSSIPVDKARKICADIPVNPQIAAFLAENRERCYILTGNLDVWIEGLVARLHMEGRCISSTAVVEDNRIIAVAHVVDKELEMERIAGVKVAIGDGSNDAKMIAKADIGIGFGGVQDVSPDILRICDYAVYEEGTLCRLLERLLSVVPESAQG